MFSALLFIFTLLPGQSSPWINGKSGHAQFRLISEKQSLDADDRVLWLGLEVKLTDGWHTYWKNPGDVGLAPDLKWRLPEFWNAGPLLYPTPIRFPAAGKTKTSSIGYSEHVIYPVQVLGNPRLGSHLPIGLKANFLVCAEICVPESIDFDLRIPVAGDRNSIFFKPLADLRNKLPKEIHPLQFRWINSKSFEVSFQNETLSDVFLFSPEKRGIFWTAQAQEKNKWVFDLNLPLQNIEVLAIGKNTAQSFLAPKAPVESQVNFWLALFFALLGGLILNIMPCVLPVFFLKANSLLQLKQGGTEYRRSLFLTVLGILMSFLILAFVTLFLKNIGANVGWGFQFQSPGFVSFLLILIFLFALNLFDLFHIQIPNAINARLARESGAFFEGMFATLLATPCSAPFLGTALAYALSQNSFTTGIFYLAMGIGLALPYLILMISPSYLTLIPRPGRWMEKLKRFLAYSLLVAALWLFYVLCQQTIAIFAVLTLGFLVLSFIFVREIRHPFKWILVAAFGIWTIFSAENFSRSLAQPVAAFSAAAIEERLSQGEKIFINITADWCLTCKFNEATVLETDWFKNALKEKNISFVQVDWTSRDEMIGAYLQKFGRVGIPFSAILSRDKREPLPELLTRSVVEKHLKDWR